MRRTTRNLATISIVITLISAAALLYSIFVPLKLFGINIGDFVFTDDLPTAATIFGATFIFSVFLLSISGSYFYQYGSPRKQMILEVLYGFCVAVIVGLPLVGLLFTLLRR